MAVAEKIRREIVKRKLSVTAAADLLDITRPAFSNVVNGNADLSVRLALKLEAEFGMDARKLLIEQLDAEINAEKSTMEAADG